MKQVIEFIEMKKHEFGQLPLFQFMKDETIHPLKRLGFVPCCAPFAMNFSDLNKHFLRETPPSSLIQERINVHTYEDEQHCLWYFQDLMGLGLDHTVNFSDALKFLWSNETQHTRLICSRLALWYTEQTDPRLKLAIVEAIEATGHVAFHRTAIVTAELQQLTEIDYPYFGKFHFDVETGHLIGPDSRNTEDLIADIELDDATYEKACELVTRVFDAFTDMVNEFMTYAKTHALEQPYASHSVSPSIAK